ncbi:phenylalanine--tRNA ligase subunit beta [archaeon]|nr:phenylalanine--tRNA ligase subunit beta [archaeon]
MPTVNLNKKEFEKLVGKKLPLDKLKDRISMLGTDLEDIKGNEIIVEVFPDRPDMISEQGFARALSSFIDAKTGLREYKVKKSNEKVIIESSVKDVRPYTACAIVKGIKFDNEKIIQVIQMQEKLHVGYGRNRKKVAIGIYPFEKIKTPIYYKALDPEKIKFRPLEFPREINGRQILSQHPAGREYAHLLEGKKKFPVFIDSDNKVLSVPPIINSHETGKITEQTTDVFIECSGFDFEVLNKALNILVTALADMNGEIFSMELNYGNKKITTPDLRSSMINLDLKYTNKILGLNLKENEIKKLLEKMGYDYKNKKVLVPAYRADIMHQIDIIEDIAIAYGYENFQEEIPNISTIGQEDEFEIFKRRIAYLLTGLDLLEASNYHLTGEEFLNKKMNFNSDFIKVKKAVNNDFNILRTWIIPSLMKTLSENKHYDYPQNIFEIGEVFTKGKTETGIKEYCRLGVTLCDKEANFTKIKQILDYLFRMLNLEYTIEDTEHSSFIPGRVGRVIVKNQKVAYIGEVSPKVITNWDLTMPIVALELNLSDLFDTI